MANVLNDIDQIIEITHDEKDVDDDARDSDGQANDPAAKEN